MFSVNLQNKCHQNTWLIMKIKCWMAMESVKTSQCMIIILYSWHLHFLTGCDIFFLWGSRWNGPPKTSETWSEVIIHKKYNEVNVKIRNFPNCNSALLLICYILAFHSANLLLVETSLSEKHMHHLLTFETAAEMDYGTTALCMMNWKFWNISTLNRAGIYYQYKKIIWCV